MQRPHARVYLGQKLRRSVRLNGLALMAHRSASGPANDVRLFLRHGNCPDVLRQTARATPRG